MSSENDFKNLLKAISELKDEKQLKAIEKLAKETRNNLQPEFKGELNILNNKFVLEKIDFDSKHCDKKLNPDEGISYNLKWKDDESILLLTMATLDGVMYAGTTMFTCQFLRIGPFIVMASFPNEDESECEGLEELFDELKPKGITTLAQLRAFIEWVQNKLNFPNIYLDRHINEAFEEIEE